MTQLETRSIELEYREDTEAEVGFIEGYAVRYGEIADIGGKYRESFARGAFAGSEDVKLYRDHRELIGHVVETEDREEGFWIRARVALTDLGRNTLALLRSGALNRFSVGFVPGSHREQDGVLVRTAALLREVSVVERPAYAGAHILAVREESTSEGDNKMTDSVTSADIVEVRNSIEELDRKIETSLSTRAVEEPVIDLRSAAAFVTAIGKEDESAIRSYNEVQKHVTDELMTRAYTGGTTANAPMQNQWVGDLTRIFDSSSSILSETFSRGTLPAKGNVLEYAQLANTAGTVTEQENEGDALSYMSVTLETATTTVHTYGGYTSLSFQAIERSTLPVLQRTLEYMAIQAGVNKKAVLRADFDKVVADRRAVASNGGVILGGAALASMDAAKWLTAILAANRRFKAQGYTVDKLIVTEDVFASLVGLTTSGDRVLRVAEGNSAGTANIRGLSASLFGVPVEVDDSPSAAAATGQAVFVNGAAIRQYDSAVVSLQDSDIIHLTKDFSVYRYGAIADEQPSLIIPVKFAAS